MSVLIDNPTNYPADAFIGSDWDRLGQLEAEAVIKGCGEGSSKKIGLVQGDQVNASSLYQYAGIMKVLAKHPDFKVVAKPDSNWDATTARNVATTMLQQNPDICGVIDFWDGDATGTAAAIREAGKEGKIFLVTTGGGEKVDCDNLQSGVFGAVVMTELQNQSRDINAIIKYPAAEQTAARHLENQYLYARKGHHQGGSQARHLLGSEGAASSGEVSCPSLRRPAGRSPSPCRGREKERIFPRW